MSVTVRVTDAEYYEASWRAAVVEAAQLRLALAEAARADFLARLLRVRDLPADGDYTIERGGSGAEVG